MFQVCGKNFMLYLIRNFIHGLQRRINPEILFTDSDFIVMSDSLEPPHGTLGLCNLAYRFFESR